MVNQDQTATTNANGTRSLGNEKHNPLRSTRRVELFCLHRTLAPRTTLKSDVAIRTLDTLKGADVIRFLLMLTCAIGSIGEIGAQQPSDNLAGEFVSRVAYKIQDRPSSNSLGHHYQTISGSLSLDGKQLLVNDFKNSKLVLIDVDSLKQETISSDPRIYTAWFDSQINAIFVLKLRDDVKIGERRQIAYPNSKDYDELMGLGLVDLYCFDSIAKIRDDCQWAL